MERTRYTQGLMFASASYIIWGFLPLFWRLLHGVSPLVILCNRVIWSFIFVLLILGMKGKLKDFLQTIKNRKMWGKLVVPSIFLTTNWLIYLWAVSNGYVIEASLGFFINPLIFTILGTLFFKERLTPLQWIGIALAGLGVVIKTIYYQKIPFVGLLLGIAFPLYGFFKKKSSLDSLNGLAFETLLIGCPALIYLIFAEYSGHGLSGNFPAYYWVITGFSGVVTAIPLLLYGAGAQRLPLTVAGFFQYISPIIMLFLGIFVFGEPFQTLDFIPFVCIWIGLICFSFSQYKLLAKKVRA